VEIKLCRESSNSILLLMTGVGADSSPGGKGRRTFQCFECDRPDPIKTDQTMAWLKGELHPPK
jgi:hypothetical protein